jgi:hypothetical protein
MMNSEEITFLDFIRKVHEERKARGLIIKGGKGSGWFAPPKGTHGKGKKDGGKKSSKKKRPRTWQGKPWRGMSPKELGAMEKQAKANYTNPRIDVPTGTKFDARDLFNDLMRKAPPYIDAVKETMGSHTGRGTIWAGGYITYVVYDKRSPDWPSEEAEQWGTIIDYSISETLGGHRKGKKAKYL